MNVIVALLIFSNLVVVPAAISRDATKGLEDRVAFCSQFVIQHPDPGRVLTYMRNFYEFSAFTRDRHKCQLYAPSFEESDHQ